MISVPGKNEQIVALIRHRACELVEKYVPKELLNGDSYNMVFNINRNEIIDYIKINYVIEELVSTKPVNKDGFYAVPSNRGYIVYEQERNIKTSEIIIVALCPNSASILLRAPRPCYYLGPH
jgi:hypothetical protein